MEVTIVVIVFLVGLIGVYFSHKKEKQRRKDLLAYARELGLSFDPNSDSNLDDRFRQFSIFRKGRNREGFNTLSGSLGINGEDHEVLMGDYRYTVDSGSGKSKSSKTYRLSYLVVDISNYKFPKLLIRPENFMDRLAGAIGFEDIDFESDEFSRKFYVSSSDKRFAYDLIDPRMMEFLMRGNSKVIDAEGGWVCIIEGKKRWNVTQFKDNVSWLESWKSHWPTHVINTLKDGGYNGGGD